MRHEQQLRYGQDKIHHSLNTKGFFMKKVGLLLLALLIISHTHLIQSAILTVENKSKDTIFVLVNDQTTTWGNINKNRKKGILTMYGITAALGFGVSVAIADAMIRAVGGVVPNFIPIAAGKSTSIVSVLPITKVTFMRILPEVPIVLTNDKKLTSTITTYYLRNYGIPIDFGIIEDMYLARVPEVETWVKALPRPILVGKKFQYKGWKRTTL